MKKFMIISLSIAVLLIAGIIILTDRGLNDVLKESYVSSLATEEIGTSKNEEEYIVYIYSDSCASCIELTESNEYQNFVNSPGVKMYKINIDSENIKINEFITEIKLEYTPTLYYIKKVGDKYTVVKEIGSKDGAVLLARHTD